MTKAKDNEFMGVLVFFPISWLAQSLASENESIHSRGEKIYERKRRGDGVLWEWFYLEIDAILTSTVQPHL